MMKNMLQILVLMALLSHSQNGISQQRDNTIKQISIGIGMSISEIQDHRMSAKTQKQWTPVYEFNYLRQSSHNRQEINFKFSSFFKSNVEDLFGYSYVRPTVSYSYQRKINEHSWIGAFLNTNTLLSFPKARSGLFSNNPINYTIATSLGPKFNWGTSLNGPNLKPIQINTSVETSLLNYVIRPAYAHPYPEQYLKEDVFSPTKRGMAVPLMKSGKLQSITKHQSFKVQMSVSYFVMERVAVSLSYQLEYHHNETHFDSSFLNQDLSVRLIYQY